MTPIEENAVLSTDLDVNGRNLLNLMAFIPAPSNLVDTADPRLSDKRPVLPGSVTDASVSETAQIQQSKLNLNGNIPSLWLGSASVEAAQGNLVQRLISKGANSGYVGLDSSGRIAAGNLPSLGPSLGTVTSVSLSLPAQFLMPTPAITTSGTFAVSWALQPDKSWFGVFGTSFLPMFMTGQIPLGLVPPFSATKFATGIFALPFLPLAIGLGPSHAIGLVPDPGDGSKGAASDYLGRDMQYHSFDMGHAYQPAVPPVVISLIGYPSPGSAAINIKEKLAGANLFYNSGSGMILASGSSINLTLAIGTTVQAFAAKAGYNNSGITSYVVPPSPTP